MSSMNMTVNKLMMALEREKGIIYCLNKTQNYSNNHNCRFTRYTLHRDYIDENGDKQSEKHYFKKLLDVVLFLYERLRSDDS